jgi:ribonuclease G
MSKELIVATGRHETRVAILEDDQLVEVFHEREKEYSLAGSIHKGRVTRVLPGMQSAFVDIGLERDAFLYVSDFFEDHEEYDAVVSTAEERVMKEEKKAPRSAETPIVMAAGAGEAIAEATAEGGAVVSSQPAQQQRDRGDRGGGDRDRGGRGRRGRRRGGGREGGGRDRGGIPESKYFSPGNERQSAPAETEEREHHHEPEREVRERIILPGESLAKYSDPEPEIEPAIPVEHHLAGLTWTPPVAEVEEEKPELIPTPDAPVETLSVEDEEAVLAAAEAVEAIQEEVLDDIAIGEPILDPEDEEGEEESDEPVSESVPEIIATEPGPEEEGPEPARSPVSLTAQLREQGHKYPHRISRRSRRRGGRGRDREPQPQPGAETAAIAPVAEADGLAIDAALSTPEVTPVVVEERRPDRGRDRDRNKGREGREGHERGGRDREPRERDTERPVLPSISDLLKEGQEIIVQISKEPLGQKGARITSHIALPGRFVVYMPTVDHAGVSRKIPSDEERQRLKRVLQTHRQGIPGGYICRTAAEGKSEEELKNDMHFLYNLWLDMRQKAEKRPAPVLLHHDLDLVQRILRDQLTTSFKTIWVDNEEHYESILRFVERFQPALVGRVKLYTRTNPIFDEFGITAELEKALRPKVWLKSGGYIVINQTEALVAIDINTGKYVGKSNRLEDTIVKINTDAIKEIVRQIRLRDLGGIIVVDFIDMDERRNRQKVMLALEDAMRVDRAPYKILQFNDFGLVAITRKRVKQSLERTLCAPCSYCEGAGYIKSPMTVITEILQEAQRMHKALAEEKGNLVLRVNPEVAKVLKSNHNSYLQEVEETLGKSVMVKSDPLLHQTKFDLA